MRLKHARVELELHELKTGTGPALLLLHALFGSSADWGESATIWPGAVYALDFSGHGRSAWSLGGGYYLELLAADADAALARIGEAAIAGIGLGAYVAVLLAGARRDAVPGALLLPGGGLSGGGPEPNYAAVPKEVDLPPVSEGARFDPAVSVLERDPRPPDYVAPVAALARRIVLMEDGTPRPPWWETVRTMPAVTVVTGDLRAGLDALIDPENRSHRGAAETRSRKVAERLSNDRPSR